MIALALMLLAATALCEGGETAAESTGLDWLKQLADWTRLTDMSDQLTVVPYSLQTEKVSHPVRIAHISDLHSCAYGNNQSELLEAIARQQADLVVLTGDIFDGGRLDDQAVALLRGLKGKYPCYFVTGNNEYERGKNGVSKIMAALKENGITVLNGGMAVVDVGGEKINLCGVEDPSAWENGRKLYRSKDASFEKQLSRVAKLADNGHYTVLLAHRPELFDDYCQMGFDLVLSGHTHGGLWRLPGQEGGVYVPGQGLFPTYTGGQYEQNGAVMIISRGLARESTAIPRINNNPELVIVDLLPAR